MRRRPPAFLRLSHQKVDAELKLSEIKHLL